MHTWLASLNPVLAAFIGGSFTWATTALGATFIFFFKTINRKILDASLGFAAGVMIAASFWSLLDPAIAISEDLNYIPWLWPLVGFLTGGLFLRALDMMLPHLHRYMRKGEQQEGPQSTLSDKMLMIIAVTIHNIPEGLAVGVAFGATAVFPEATIASAIALTIGIGIQNIPEGFAVSMPLLEEKMSKRKAFFWGQASGSVEAVAAVIGAILVIQMQALLPFALGFAAGAMIFVVVEEVIPQSQSAGNNDLATGGAMLGFAIMMLLDVALS
ncbi:ZIP family metal transporter [Entomospira entomophila]|uniref:ZIP family metal transporter n=1 Tax=Entomospira entomophila TaxID=2719988 RepID=A0A968KRI7_9SPIO|nr:ZIP family metal transporter [Entomospira entomophilus]NIZ40799.1 ZIP family metal transporter [Entomospira entomophilus]WDI35011.1 ZIP family metal transporter [Entomospira entomophilus]